MAYQPRNYLPIYKGADANDDALQLPAQVVRQTSVSPNWDPTQDIQAAAESVESYYSGMIDQFMGQSRLMHDRSGLDSNRYNHSSPGIDLRYENVFGTEKLYVTVAPENAPSGSQASVLNFDGYIFILNYFSGGGGTAGQEFPYDFQINGQSVGNYTFTLGKVEGVAIKIGSTALKCWSIADVDSPKANPNKKVNQILPPRLKTKAFTNTEYWFPFAEGGGVQAQIPAHDDLPLYALYDWNSDENTGAMNPNTAFSNFLPNGLTQMALYNIPITYITPDFSNGSPIKNRGLNKFRAKVKKPITYFMGDGDIIIQAEFYSRYYLRPVDQTWYSNTPGNVNDTPLYFGVRTRFMDNLALDFDLTPREINRTTPTPASAYDNTGTAPYVNGYWRPGDQWSVYAVRFGGSYDQLTDPVNQYYTFINQLKEFFDNKYGGGQQVIVSFNPMNGTNPIGEDDSGDVPTYYWNATVSNYFWAQPFSNQGYDPFLNPNNNPYPDGWNAACSEVYDVLSAQVPKWAQITQSINLAQQTQSVYYADTAAVTYVNQLLSDAKTLMKVLVGADISGLPQNPTTAQFDSVFYNSSTNPNVPYSNFWKIVQDGEINPPETVFAGSFIGLQTGYRYLVCAGFCAQSVALLLNTITQTLVTSVTTEISNIAAYKDV